MALNSGTVKSGVRVHLTGQGCYGIQVYENRVNQELHPFFAERLLESVRATFGATIHTEAKRPRSKGRYAMKGKTKRRRNGSKADAQKIPLMLRATTESPVTNACVSLRG